MYCSNCGTEQEAGARFCGACGKSTIEIQHAPPPYVAPPMQPPEAQPPIQRAKPNLLIIIIPASAIILLLTVITIMHYTTDIFRPGMDWDDSEQPGITAEYPILASTPTPTPTPTIREMPSRGGTFTVTSNTEYLFTPTVSGLWELSTSDNGDSDPILEIRDADGRQIAYNDDNGEDSNAYILIELEAGVSYVIAAEFFDKQPQHSYMLTVWQISRDMWPSATLAQWLTTPRMQAFEEANAVSVEQQRYLAFGAFLLTNNRESSRVFAVEESQSSAANLLNRAWSVDSRESALVQLENLSTATGQSPSGDDIYNVFIKNGLLEPIVGLDLLIYDVDLTGLESLIARSTNRAERMPEQFEAVSEILSAFGVEEEDLFEAFVMMIMADRINDGIEAYLGAREMLIGSFGYTEEELLNLPTLAAWDYGRTTIIARYGVAAGYLEEDEAWEYLKEAADRAASTYSNWREYTAAHILGRAIAFGNPSDDFFYTLDFLLNHSQSPFQAVDFHN